MLNTTYPPSVFELVLRNIAHSHKWQIEEDRVFGFGALLGWSLKTPTHAITLNVNRIDEIHEELLLVYVRRYGISQNLKHTFRPIAHILRHVLEAYPKIERVMCHLADLSHDVPGGLPTRRLQHYVHHHLKAVATIDSNGQTWWRFPVATVFEVASKKKLLSENFFKSRLNPNDRSSAALIS